MNNRPNNDATFDDAAHMVVLMQSASVNDLRVKLKLTDAKAHKVMEKLANVGIVRSMDENGSAKVLISNFIDLEPLLSARHPPLVSYQGQLSSARFGHVSCFEGGLFWRFPFR